MVNQTQVRNPRVDLEAIKRAFEFSYHAHDTQKRASGEAYIAHPVAVARIVSDIGLDEASIMSALLHDTVEDTPKTLQDIRTTFTPEIATLVDGVTKLSQLEKKTDEANPVTTIQQAENLRKLILAMAEDIRVLLIKLADRLHNMRTLSFIQEAEKRKVVARETLEIYTPLAERIGMQTIKEELEDLAFSELNPDARSSIQTLLRQRRIEGQDRIVSIIQELKSLLDSQPIDCVAIVTGREKTAYSIWRKLQYKQRTFSQLEDIMAFRVTLETIEQCYQVLGIFHARYPIIPGRFKDYISLPKKNGYKSLHTCLIGPNQERIEIQIRTKEMHEVCELGVAAHWAYKQKTSAETSAQLFKELKEIAQNSQPAEEFLEHTKLELYADQVFCFTPRGKLIVLPKNATPIDFAYQVHSEVGDRCTGALIGGTMQPLRTILRNGDVVQILTSKSQTPSPDWYRFAVTGKAKSHIRRFLTKQQRPQSIQLGKQMIQKVCRQEGVEFSEKDCESVLKQFKSATTEILFFNVGKGFCSAREVVNALLDKKTKPPEIPPFLKEETPKSPPSKAGKDVPLPILGLLPGMAIHYARCCHPLVGDRIKGVITTGKGITIHTSDCETLEAFEYSPERLIDVAWSNDASNNVPLIGRLSVILSHRANCFSIFSTAIEKNDGHITNMKFINRNPDFFEMLVDVDVKDVHHLNNIIASLRALSVVAEVRRFRGH